MRMGKSVDRAIRFCALSLMMLGLSVSGAECVRVGTMSKADALDDTLRLMSEEGLGDFVFGHGEDWTPEKVRACLEACRSKGFVFALPELQGRQADGQQHAAEEDEADEGQPPDEIVHGADNLGQGL